MRWSMNRTKGLGMKERMDLGWEGQKLNYGPGNNNSNVSGIQRPPFADAPSGNDNKRP